MAAQRGYRHWTIIGLGAAILIIVFLFSLFPCLSFILMSILCLGLLVVFKFLVFSG